MLNSPIEPFFFNGSRFWLKRDDLLHEQFDGNKARKFYSLATSDLSRYEKIVSYGGTQSNAMYSLSFLAASKGLEFHYYSRKLSQNLAKNPSGNLKHALSNGMKLFELSNDEYECISYENFDDKTLFIPQGGACGYAEEGIKLLSGELNDFCAEQNIENPKAILSCGTGTTALYLQKHFKGEVFAVPCVGSGEYLKQQFDELQPDIAHPKIIDTGKKYRFAIPHDDLLQTYKELLKCGVEFDLLYDCKAWIAVLEHIELFDDKNAIFVHSGGLRGNETMLQRYSVD